MDVIDTLADKYYDKFSSAMDEYIFMAMTEDCHPLIVDIEKINCITEGMDWDTYLDGGDETGDLLHSSHTMAQAVVNRMHRKYVNLNL